MSLHTRKSVLCDPTETNVDSVKVTDLLSRCYGSCWFNRSWSTFAIVLFRRGGYHALPTEITLPCLFTPVNHR